MSDSARPLLILGTGNFAAEVADLVSEIGGWTVTGFVESLDRERCGTLLRRGSVDPLLPV